MRRSDVPVGSTKMLVLKLLSQKPMHGYEIIKEMDERSRGVFTLNEGTLYPLLHQLERDGLLEASWQERRKVYALTEDGTRALAQQHDEWRRLRSAVDAILEGT